MRREHPLLIAVLLLLASGCDASRNSAGASRAAFCKFKGEPTFSTACHAPGPRCHECRSDKAISNLRQAVAAEDRLAYHEPRDWFFPARHLLGAQLLLALRLDEAESVYREDLKQNPENGWALFGLSATLKAQGKPIEAAHIAQRFQAA